MQTVKQGLRQMQGGSIQENLSKLLFKYRITPHSTTGIPPSELLMGRRLRSRLDLLFPDVSSNVEDKQFKQKLAHDNMKSCRSFVVGEEVFAEDFSNSSEKWIPGVVSKVTGPLSFQIDLSNDKTVRRHVDNVWKRVVKEGKRSEDTTREEVVWGNVSGNTEVSASEPAPVVTETSSSPTTSQPTDFQPIVQPTSQPIVQPTDRYSTTVRRSVRIRHPPDRFDHEPYS